MTRTNSATKSTKASSLASEGRYPPPDNNTNQSTHAKSQTDFHISLMLNKRHTPSSSPSPSSSAHSTSSPPIMKLKPCTPPEESEQPRDGGNRERERKSSSSNEQLSPVANSSSSSTASRCSLRFFRAQTPPLDEMPEAMMKYLSTPDRSETIRLGLPSYIMET